MNNSVNYGNFIDLLIASKDDYEPYGMSAQPITTQLSAPQSEYEPMQATLYDRTLNTLWSD